MDRMIQIILEFTEEQRKIKAFPDSTKSHCPVIASEIGLLYTGRRHYNDG
jgi:hypothetical protein